MYDFRNGIPYCARCSRKAKKADLKVNEYFCPIVANTPMNGIVTGDTDGSECVELGVYLPINLTECNDNE